MERMTEAHDDSGVALRADLKTSLDEISASFQTKLKYLSEFLTFLLWPFGFLCLALFLAYLHLQKQKQTAQRIAAELGLKLSDTSEEILTPPVNPATGRPEYVPKSKLIRGIVKTFASWSMTGVYDSYAVLISHREDPLTEPRKWLSGFQARFHSPLPHELRIVGKSLDYPSAAIQELEVTSLHDSHLDRKITVRSNHPDAARHYLSEKNRQAALKALASGSGAFLITPDKILIKHPHRRLDTATYRQRLDQLTSTAREFETGKEKT